MINHGVFRKVKCPNAKMCKEQMGVQNQKETVHLEHD